MKNLLLDVFDEMADSISQASDIVVILAILSCLVPLLMYFNRVQRSGDLKTNFRKLGDMTGMHKDTIIEKVGAPSAIHYMHDFQLLQWYVPGYHISIRFGPDGFFKGIQSEIG